MKKHSLWALVSALLILSSCSYRFTPDGSSDIGDIKLPGSMSYELSSDTFTLTASGENMWFGKDAFFFVWKRVSGDFEISGDIAFKGEGHNAHRKIGFIVRESLDADSKYADIAIHGDGLTSLQYRPAVGADTEESVSQNVAPTTIQLVRKGSTIGVRTGKGGLQKEFDTSITLDLPKECYVGMFMCSHEIDVVETGYVKNVVFHNK